MNWDYSQSLNHQNFTGGDSFNESGPYVEYSNIKDFNEIVFQTLWKYLHLQRIEIQRLSQTLSATSESTPVVEFLPNYHTAATRVKLSAMCNTNINMPPCHNTPSHTHTGSEIGSDRSWPYYQPSRNELTGGDCYVC